MQEVEGYESGERDYMNLKGDTGPLVYPAGFVHLFSWLKSITGGDVALAQVVFAILYLATHLVVMGIYIHTKSFPPIGLVLLCLSRRIHSIFVLRLFNDCWAMFVAYIGVWLLQRRHVSRAIFAFSVAVSIKMNVLLFAPGVLVVAMKVSNIADTLKGVIAGSAFQIAVALPFIREHPWSYLSRAFEFSRVFIYKWTVNWKFIPEQWFLSKQFAILLLLIHLRLLWAFVNHNWFIEEGGVRQALIQFFRVKRSCPKVNSDRIVSIVFMSNFLGILCARSLHYQFYSWYFHTVPFLLIRNNVPLLFKLIVFLGIEVSWNIFPSTAYTSANLFVMHLCLLIFSAKLPQENEIPGKRE